MNDASKPLLIYQTNVAVYQKQLDTLKTKRSRIGWLRLFVFLVTVVIVYYTWTSSALIVITAITIGVACFLFIVSADANLKQQMENLQRFLLINNDEINILLNNYYSRETGKEFEPPIHTYSHDLDMFGTASMYQYLSRCTSEQSKQMLANHLLQPLAKNDILKTQNAVKELAPKVAWRQQFQSYGIESPVSCATENRILIWLKQNEIFHEQYWRWLAVLFPLFTIGCAGLFIAGIIEWTTFSSIVFVCFIIAGSFSKKIQPTWILLSRTVNEINTLRNQLEHLENESFSNEYIAAIKQQMRGEDAQNASSAIKRLGGILNRFDVRLNVFAFFFLNTFLLWDVWQMLSLNKWKSANKNAVANWFSAIAEMEVVSSIASLSFNHSAWCFPQIADEHFTLHGQLIGHPLIDSAKMVSNSFSVDGMGKVALVTGSNMGGKSTFLRSIGVNTVLAMMGAPVCAKAFTISPVKLMSSMRIADNLAENTSTFYAELKKLEQVIAAVNHHEKIFILLDEILRGTNSIDRHTGSKALIKQLVKQRAIAIIATHDVELALLETQYPQAVSNYHFDVQVDDNDELYFDFKLKTGICKSMNASILMRKIGIEMEQEQQNMQKAE